MAAVERHVRKKDPRSVANPRHKCADCTHIYIYEADVGRLYYSKLNDKINLLAIR